jgi:hypothetical protein
VSDQAIYQMSNRSVLCSSKHNVAVKDSEQFSSSTHSCSSTHDDQSKVAQQAVLQDNWRAQLHVVETLVVLDCDDVTLQ